MLITDRKEVLILLDSKYKELLDIDRKIAVHEETPDIFQLEINNLYRKRNSIVYAITNLENCL